MVPEPVCGDETEGLFYCAADVSCLKAHATTQDVSSITGPPIANIRRRR
jgi:hypothetical protein